MAKKEVEIKAKGDNSFAFLSIVAIIAIVALVVLVTGVGKRQAMPTYVTTGVEGGDLVGQPIAEVGEEQAPNRPLTKVDPHTDTGCEVVDNWWPIPDTCKARQGSNCQTCYFDSGGNCKCKEFPG
ncbi:hypothetical protein JW968_07040 [Candidatus Woesearchaeota archaeon]|nr:hypothetical protein [Candidatus Woesearchaeota archaeon]